MRKSINLSLFLALIIGVSVASFAMGKQSTSVASLNAFNDHFNASVIAGDADALVNMYDDKALWIEQGKPVAQGLEEPRKLFNFITSNKGQVNHTIDNLFVSEDSSLAVMIGSVEAKLEKIGMDATGTYLFVLRPDGKTWKIVTDMWHQHAPAKSESSQ
ncbi:hypothetical protein GCM10009133_18700 [Cocleimonas flava]|uniref:Ketosteroid isomerase-like protein n=1 Tax=Cocleimonas flava TaxID=634765 RepID=A0A4R1EXR6_9GAMM|nr:nuclear transport factor 2 family protein [Cocleimonas flava]TCJ84794.1 ketosteroid isomerase-like protein [Cocleimonas flava]